MTGLAGLVVAAAAGACGAGCTIFARPFEDPNLQDPIWAHENGSWAVRHYLGVSSRALEEAVLHSLLTLGFLLEDGVDEGVRDSSRTWVQHGRRPWDGRTVVVVEEEGLGSVRVSVEIVPSDEDLAVRLQNEIGSRVRPQEAPGGKSPAP